MILGFCITWALAAVVAALMPNDCPDCRIVACEECGENLGRIDQQIDGRIS